eukprot:1161666-Pelagomonas_calceolata.AAC.6
MYAYNSATASLQSSTAPPPCRPQLLPVHSYLQRDLPLARRHGPRQSPKVRVPAKAFPNEQDQPRYFLFCCKIFHISAERPSIASSASPTPCCKPFWDGGTAAVAA